MAGTYQERFELFNDQRLIPPGINDERSKAVLGMFAHGAALLDFSKLLMRNAGEMPDEVLPEAIYERSLAEYILPEGYPPATIRKLVDGSFEIHAQQGTEGGITFGLELIGANGRITQWYEEDPVGHHDTFRVDVDLDAPIVNENTADVTKDREAITRMVKSTQRHSQDEAINFGYRTDTPAYAAVHDVLSGNIVDQHTPEDQDVSSDALIAIAAILAGEIIEETAS